MRITMIRANNDSHAKRNESLLTRITMMRANDDSHDNII